VTIDVEEDGTVDYRRRRTSVKRALGASGDDGFGAGW
jgi:hypothetical protein